MDTKELESRRITDVTMGADYFKALRGLVWGSLIAAGIIDSIYVYEAHYLLRDAGPWLTASALHLTGFAVLLLGVVGLPKQD